MTDKEATLALLDRLGLLYKDEPHSAGSAVTIDREVVFEFHPDGAFLRLWAWGDS